MPEIYSSLKIVPEKESKAILTMSNDSPLLLHSEKNNTFVFSLPLTMKWSSLPTSGLFLPLLHRLLIALVAADDALFMFVVGENVQLPLEKEYLSTEIEMVKPSGDRLFLIPNYRNESVIIDDMNEPLSTNLNFYFHGQFVDTLVTDGDGNFYYEYKVPTDSDAGPNAISVHYISEGFYRASSSTWQLQVYHNTRIVMNDSEGILDTTVPITGYAYDKADRPISNLSIRLVLDSGFPIDGITDSNGKFSIPLPLPFGLELGNHNLTATFAGNNYYISNFTESKIHIMGETQIVLDIPHSLEYQQSYSGEITLSMYDGTPVSGASLLVKFEPEGMTFMIITDLNGTATFDSIFSGNMTIPMVVKVTYTGSENYIGNEVESTIVYRPPVEQSNYSFWIVMAASLVGASGVILGWKWYRERHLREIQRILEATASALEANMDYRDSIVYSYKEMCKILNGYGYLRRHFETVREFQQALQDALSLDHDSVARLTLLYEEADYTTKSLDDDHRLNAVSSLRTVIQSLDDYSKKEE